MSAATPHRPFDTAVVAARDREDVIVGNEIVRHRLVSRLIHWSVALTFFVSVFTGMPIWSPVFGWMAHLFGGLTVCRLLHPWMDVGKYNGGQKLFFWAAGLGAVGLLLSGLLIWFPRAFPRLLLEFSYLIHDVTFILFAVAIVFHIYLATAAEPGTFGSMIRGTVTREWARLHHARWYREVIRGDETPRR